MSTLTLKKPVSNNQKKRAAWDWCEANFVAFEKNLRPLAIGVAYEINKRIRENTDFEYSKRVLRKVVSGYIRQKVYKKALMNSRYRYTLDGEAVERTLDDLENAGYTHLTKEAQP